MQAIWVGFLVLGILLVNDGTTGMPSPHGKDSNFACRHDERELDDYSIYALTNPDPIIRARAVQDLRGVKAGIPSLIKALRDPDDSVRKQAAQSLGCKGFPSTEVVPALVLL
jgi:HEAT repeat protein